VVTGMYLVKHWVVSEAVSKEDQPTAP
jgi:hypothetical protein